MLEVARGKDPAAEKRAERGAGTFAELAAAYVETLRQEDATRAGSRPTRWSAATLLPRWGKLQAATHHPRRRPRPDGPHRGPGAGQPSPGGGSARSSRWAVKEEIMRRQPLQLVSSATRPGAASASCATSEVPRFWTAFDDAGLVACSALKTILLTGQRPGECAHMRREHIVDGWWEMPGEPVPALGWPGTKNGESHRVWLPKPVQDIIAELSDGATTGFVFAGPRGRPVHGLDAAMRAICKKLGVERATPHDLRRTHGTTITALGFGRDAMNRIQNHKEGGIASVYDRHEYAEENKRIMETVAAKIMALVEGRTDEKVRADQALKILARDRADFVLLRA